MKRITIYDDDGNYVGWFDEHKAKEIASYKAGNPYVNGKVLLRTARNKLIVNSWNNTGRDNYRFAEDEVEVAEILSAGGYSEGDEKLEEILYRYEL